MSSQSTNYNTVARRRQFAITEGFPEEFAHDIKKRFLIGIILQLFYHVVIPLLFSLLFSSKPIISSILFIRDILFIRNIKEFGIAIIFPSITGIVFSIFYNSTEGDLYWSYKVREPKNMFLTLVIIILSLIGIMTLSGIASPFIIKYLGKNVSAPAIVVRTACFLLFSFIVDLIYTLCKHKKYTCKNCNLTNALEISSETLYTKEEDRGYWDKGGYYTKHYKVNGEDVSITYETAPEYHERHVRISDMKYTYHCPICDKVAYIKRRKETH